MSGSLEVRESARDDAVAIEALYPHAFPDEDLVPLVKALLRDPDNVLSLVATQESKVVGHGAFTRCSVTGSDVQAALLGPLAVAPDRQRQGVGSAIIRAGFECLREQAVALVLVLGDPAYYGRFGFVTESLIRPPYLLPAEWAEAWQSTKLGGRADIASGSLSVPPVWRDPALWAP